MLSLKDNNQLTHWDLTIITQHKLCNEAAQKERCLGRLVLLANTYTACLNTPSTNVIQQVLPSIDEPPPIYELGCPSKDNMHDIEMKTECYEIFEEPDSDSETGSESDSDDEFYHVDECIQTPQDIVQSYRPTLTSSKAAPGNLHSRPKLGLDGANTTKIEDISTPKVPIVKKRFYADEFVTSAPNMQLPDADTYQNGHRAVQIIHSTVDWLVHGGRSANRISSPGISAR